MNKGRVRRRRRDRRGRHGCSNGRGHTGRRHQHEVGGAIRSTRRNLLLLRDWPRGQLERCLKLLQLRAIAVVVACRRSLGVHHGRIWRARHCRQQRSIMGRNRSRSVRIDLRSAAV